MKLFIKILTISLALLALTTSASAAQVETKFDGQCKFLESKLAEYTVKMEGSNKIDTQKRKNSEVAVASYKKRLNLYACN